MLRYKLVIFFILINTSVIFSQNGKQFGLLLGLNKSQIIGDGYSGYHRTGFNAGGFSRIIISKNSTLQLEVFYISKGCSSKPYKESGKSRYYYFDMLHYVQIPLLFNYSLKNYFFEIGPAVGLLIWNLDHESTATKTLAASCNFLEQTGNVGFGYLFNKNTGIEIRYTQSILPVRKIPTKQYNSTFQLCLFYTFLSGKK